MLNEDTFLNKQLLAKAKKDGVKLYHERYEAQLPICPFGTSGICCKVCFSGPCKVTNERPGICGAKPDTVIARNILRIAAAGATCHTDHAKEILLALLKISEGKTTAYGIKDEKKLRAIAKKLGKKETGPINKVAKEVALEALEDFRRQEGLFHKSEGDYLNWLRINAPKERIQTWKKLKALPVSADKEIVNAFHRSTMGNDADPDNLLKATLTMGLVDGYSGLYLGTDLQDVIFGTPYLTKSTANLGTLKEDHVNIIVHGHVPLLSEKVREWSEKMQNSAKKLGAKGINVVGMCCTGNELLQRQGIPFIGHVLQQELALVTGAVDATVVDLHCIYPSLQDIANCYHTRLITTIDFVKIPGALNLEFEVEKADQIAKRVINEALEAYKKRDPAKVNIPKDKSTVYAGFSKEAIEAALTKVNPKNPYKPLIDNLKEGNIYGIVALAGCRNPKLNGLKFLENLAEILLKNNVLLIGTGCAAHSLAQQNLMTPEGAAKAGPKLRKVLEAIGKANDLDSLPPALHMGSCVDNSRVARLLGELSSKLKVPIKDLPIAAAAPEYMTEKAFAIGIYFLAMGVDVHINPVPPVTGAPNYMKKLTKGMHDIDCGNVLIGLTPEAAAKEILNSIKTKRKALGWQ